MADSYDITLVDVTKVRKNFIMNVAAINTMLLFYIGVILAVIFVAIMVYTGKIEKKRSR